MKILFSRSSYRALKRPPLTAEERDRCLGAIERFVENPRHPGLNFERLDRWPERNHCSIRASKELRVILAVPGPSFANPETAMVVNMGHHDSMYDWARRQDFFSDPAEGVDVCDLVAEESPATALRSLNDFEEWQVFLYPEQAKWTTRRFSGPARIRGGAGTGKTVIALHRAAELGRRFPDGKVLFSTFSRSLVSHLRTLYDGIPNAPGNVEFRSVFQVARHLLGPFEIDDASVRRSFDAAYDRIVPGTGLAGCGRAYLKEEIERVIKGRRASREEYLDTDRFQRLGRILSMRRRERETCWRLREAWDEEMERAGTTSWPDILIRAQDEVAARDAGLYRAVVVDEGQDMTASGMSLLRCLVAGGSDNPVPADGFFYVDDAAQQIYAGGFHPTWAGLDIRGRSITLETAYRTTRQIMDAATAVRDAGSPVDAGGDNGPAPIEEFGSDDGHPPAWLQRGKRQEIETIARGIEHLVRNEDFGEEEIGVFARGNDEADLCARALGKRGFLCAPLKELTLDDAFPPGIRIGTFDRCKGLEFRAVFIPRLGASVFPGRYVGDPKPELDAPDSRTENGNKREEEEREHRQLMLDRLYVGMTRARERLYLVSDEAPDPILEPALSFCDIYPPSRPPPWEN